MLKASRYVVAIGSEDLKSFYHLIRTLGLEKDDSRWTRDLWSKGVTLILGFRKEEFLLELCDDSLRFSNTWAFGFFANHPTVHSGGVIKGRV